MADDNEKNNQWVSGQDGGPTVELDKVPFAAAVVREASDMEADQATADYAGRSSNRENENNTVSNSQSGPSPHGGTDGELKFEVELLRSKWTGLTKEVEALEKMVGNIANDVKVVNNKQLQTSRLIEIRDKEITSLRSQLIDRERDVEELCRSQALPDSQRPGLSARPYRGDTNDQRDKLALLVPRNGNVSDGHRISTGILTLGSGPDNDVRIQNNFISRHHAQIASSGSNCILSDLNSTNGTYVNSKRIKRHVLHDGDAIIIGKDHFKYVKSNLDTPDHFLNFNEVQGQVTESRATNLLQGGSKESM